MASSLLISSTILILGVLSEVTSFQWTSSNAFPDNSTIPACPEQDMTLGWDYVTSPTEHVVNIEWRFQPLTGGTEISLATEVNGHFFASPSSAQHVQALTTAAGIRLLALNNAYTGTYSVHVNLHDGGVVHEMVQRVTVMVTDDPIVTEADKALHARLEGARYVPATGQHHVILSCGTVSPTWLSRVKVVWTTPSSQSVPSMSEENGRYFLAVPNPLESGEYTCHIDSLSPVSLCIADSSPLNRGATLLLDGVSARIALMNSEMETMRQVMSHLGGEVQGLETNKTFLLQQLLILQAENDRLAAQIEIQKTQNQNLSHQIDLLNSGASSIRLVGGRNSHEGRVEVLVNGQWGTVCDDSFGTEEATVVCRQLGLPTTHATAFPSAHFGEGRVPIVMDETHCSGSERQLTDCPFDPRNDCTHSEDAGVSCGGLIG